MLVQLNVIELIGLNYCHMEWSKQEIAREVSNSHLQITVHCLRLSILQNIFCPSEAQYKSEGPTLQLIFIILQCSDKLGISLSLLNDCKGRDISNSVNYHKHDGFKVLTVGTTKSMVSWFVKLRSSETAKHFGGTHCLHPQGQRMSQARW